MKAKESRRSVHIVKWQTPFSPAISPYRNPLAIVRWLSYMRFQAALDAVEVNARRVLEIGCWDGHFLPSLAKNFSEVWAVDDDSASAVDMCPGFWSTLEVAHRLCEWEIVTSAQPTLVKATACRLPFPDGYFDVVFCIDTLAHVSADKRADVLSELHRVTRSGGQVIFSLPVEVGFIRLLRQTMRVLTRRLRDPQLKGYDFRRDLQSLESAFESCSQRFYPLHALRGFNPFVLIDCRVAEEQFGDFPRVQGPPDP